MGEGKNRISVIVDDLAKENLVAYQMQARIKTRDGAVEEILHKVPEWQAKIKALEDHIKELEAKKS
ncbi:Uncharacterised protein [uncultured archaeon]|nr:Uncharacterised protein [uncultured archaeon]